MFVIMTVLELLLSESRSGYVNLSLGTATGFLLEEKLLLCANRCETDGAGTLPRLEATN